MNNPGQMGSPEILHQSTPSPEVTAISQEVKENVLGIVRDISKSGFGVTGFIYHSRDFVAKGDRTHTRKEPFNGDKFEALRSVLDKGLLGLSEFDTKGDKIRDDESLADRWYRLARKTRSTGVFGNIIGKDIYDDDVSGSFAAAGQNFAILYDISDLKETMPHWENYDEGDILAKRAQVMKRKEFWAARHPSVSADPYKSKKLISREETTKLVDSELMKGLTTASFPEFLEALNSHKAELVELGLDAESLIARVSQASSYSELGWISWPDHGYVMGRRIAPRKFMGLLWGSPSKNDFPNGNSTLDKELQEIQAIFEHVNDTGKQVYLPVYDREGNLWWPEKISHQEIAAQETLRATDH
jgi:hypothetical protein